MRSILTIYRKELSDYFSSKKFLILLGLVYITGLTSIYVAIQNIRVAAQSSVDSLVFLKLFTTSGDVLPSFLYFLSFFIPIIGIVFGFDAINSEKNSKNLSRLLSQPIYRDSIINGKFLAGITTMTIIISSIILIIAGIGLRVIGVPPSAEEILRIIIFIAICVCYGTFWMSMAMLFSVVLDKTATSILTSVAIWIFFFFFVQIIASAVANVMAPLENASLATQIKNFNIDLGIKRLSPSYLFMESITILLIPSGSHIFLRAVTTSDISNMILSPLSLGQSLVQVWPQIIAIIALAIICFAISYVVFIKQEIRST
ncbi:MAG TPA: ABC transporter permease subunit [Actinobacteria bacterium]|nr:ABC transporter permease subunit [Actinomycetota bacterium]